MEDRIIFILLIGSIVVAVIGASIKNMKYKKFEEKNEEAVKRAKTKKQIKSVTIDGEEVLIEDLVKESEEYFEQLPETATRRYHTPEDLAPNGLRESHLNDYDHDADDEFEALVCPNCGAPLRAIYEPCAYCGCSYREALERLKGDLHE